MRTLLMTLAPIALVAMDLASAASFPCEKASTTVEKMVCADAALSEYDEHLGRYYRGGRITLGAAGQCLVKDQRDWLSTKRNKCKDKECLKRVYLERLAELDALQPGMTAVKNIDLPHAKAMVWALPPAEDTVAAPSPKKPEPLVLKGKIVDDIENGDGIVLQTPDGAKHVLLALMFIDKPSSVALESFIRDANATYEVRGVLESSGDKSKHFSPGACRFIYRQP